MRDLRADARQAKTNWMFVFCVQPTSTRGCESFRKTAPGQAATKGWAASRKRRGGFPNSLKRQAGKLPRPPHVNGVPGDRRVSIGGCTATQR